MASVKSAYDTLVSLTVTALQSLASSATVGWQSAKVDNTTNLYLDALVQVVLTHAATAPGSSRGEYIFAYGGIETGVLTNPVSGSEGTITLTDVTTTSQNLRQLGFMPYNTSGETVESSPMSVAAAFGGVLPHFWGIVIMNHSGAALSTSCTVKYSGVTSTVV